MVRFWSWGGRVFCFDMFRFCEFVMDLKLEESYLFALGQRHDSDEMRG